LRIQDVQVWVRAEDHSAPTVTQLLAQSAVVSRIFHTSVKSLFPVIKKLAEPTITQAKNLASF